MAQILFNGVDSSYIHKECKIIAQSVEDKIITEKNVETYLKMHKSTCFELFIRNERKKYREKKERQIRKEQMQQETNDMLKQLILEIQYSPNNGTIMQEAKTHFETLANNH